MPRPVKWARDVHPIRDRARRSKTETWSRPDLEHLFDVGPSSAQTLMKAIGEVQTVGGTHFIDRAALLRFLDEMIAAPSVEAALRSRLEHAAPPPQHKPVRVTLPADLRNVMLPELPANVTLEPGRLEVRGGSAVEIVECLLTLGLIMQNDLDGVLSRLDPPTAPQQDSGTDDGLRQMLHSLRGDFPARS